VRAKPWTLSFVFLLLAPCALLAAGNPVCGENDLMFGCTKTEEKGRLRAGCGVHDRGNFFPSSWRIYDLQTEGVLGKTVPAGPDGIALVEIPKVRWFIIEGELRCSRGGSELAVPYRFLAERTGKDSFRQRAYTPENLVATGNWNADTQLHYGAFRSRSLVGSAPAAASGR
jgi:hypothetical protein